MTWCEVRDEQNVCTKCGQEKTCEEMKRASNCRHGHSHQCKGCASQNSKEWREAHPDRFKSARRKSVLKLQYGISPEDYQSLMDEQGGACKICGLLSERTLDVDHCHTTGRVRGLLCNNCNRALGYARDDPKVLRLMAEYLEGGDA